MDNNFLSDCILVGVDFSKGEDKGMLIVGRDTPKNGIEIINALQGYEAYALYKKLVGEDSKTNA